MVMGTGSEKAGVRLDDYRNKLLRVGEWMFTDGEYAPKIEWKINQKSTYKDIFVTQK